MATRVIAGQVTVTGMRTTIGVSSRALAAVATISKRPARIAFTIPWLTRSALRGPETRTRAARSSLPLASYAVTRTMAVSPARSVSCVGSTTIRATAVSVRAADGAFCASTVETAAHVRTNVTMRVGSVNLTSRAPGGCGRTWMMRRATSLFNLENPLRRLSSLLGPARGRIRESGHAKRRADRAHGTWIRRSLPTEDQHDAIRTDAQIVRQV